MFVPPRYFTAGSMRKRKAGPRGRSRYSDRSGGGLVSSSEEGNASSRPQGKIPQIESMPHRIGDAPKPFIAGLKRKASPVEESPSSDRIGDGLDMGAFSCFRGKEEDKRRSPVLEDLGLGMEEYYVEAARRLPLAEIPELAACINVGGHCFGLADPVSNIILNAVGLLVHRELARYEPPKTCPLIIPTTSIDGKVMSMKSLSGLLAFMTGYFRHLSRIQARRYLHLASYDLALAICLVRSHRQGFSFSQQKLLPDGGMIKNALRAAAIRAEHPVPQVLACLMTARYPSGLLSDVLSKLQPQRLLTLSDLCLVKELLKCQWPPQPTSPPVNMHFCCRPDSSIYCKSSVNGGVLISTDAGDEDCVVQIMIQKTIKDQQSPFPDKHYIPDDLTFSCGMEPKLSRCLAAVSWGDDDTPTPTDEHLQYLELHVLDMIHAFYIKALAALPIRSDPNLLRAFLVAGHCYGLLNPVSNIIINSCWYNTAFPLCNQVEALNLPRLKLPGCFDEGPYCELPDGIVDTTSMARLAYRSLDGLVAALCVGANKSRHQALEFLSASNCDVSRALIHPSVFADAARAAKHPQHAEFGSFLSFRCSDDMIYSLPDPAMFIYPLSTEYPFKFIPSTKPLQNDEAPPYTLMVPAAQEVMSKKYLVRDMLAFLRDKLDVVLREYNYQHPWEPAFELDVICGVNEPSFRGSLHHVNFFARSEEARIGRTLFFAELWVGSMPEKSSSCSPVYDYIERVGRCSFCEKKGSKIIHPPSGGHFGDLDGSLVMDVSHPHERRSSLDDLLLEMDFVYFDPARDGQIAKKLDSRHSYCQFKELGPFSIRSYTPV